MCPRPDELAAAAELREELGEQPARWLETGELLRFVRARKTLKERASLFREAMAWRRDHPDWIEDEASFGGAEQRWCDDPATAPAWHRWMGTVLPFELFGTCRSGVPITFVGLGRMDLTGIQREIGLDRLEQKMVMQNDAFIDLARREGCDGRPRRMCRGAWGVCQCGNHRRDACSMAFGRIRLTLGEVRIFKRCAAALKVLHPERQRKTFIVRAPRVFAVFWKIVRVFLDERIISKISILGVNDDLTPLVDEVGADYLPLALWRWV